MIKIPFNRVIRLMCGVFLSTVMFACGDNTSSTTVQATYTSLWDNVFSGCGVNCHNSSASDFTDLGPDMSTKANFYAQVVGKSVNIDYSSWASVKNGDCNSVSFIKPGSANDSTLAAALILTVSDTLAATYNCTTAYSYHAQINQAISDMTTQNALISWINSGAQNN